MKVIYFFDGDPAGSELSPALSLLEALRHDESALPVIRREGAFSRAAAAKGQRVQLYSPALSREAAPDLVHCIGPGALKEARGLARKWRVPVAVSLWDREQISAPGLRRAQLWLTATDALGDALIRQGCAAQRVFSPASDGELSLSFLRETEETFLRRENRRREKSRDGILLCGAYGVGNAGDEAILQSIIAAVRGLDPDIPVTVLAKNPMSIRTRLRVKAIHTLDFFHILPAMTRTRLYINGGGTLIQNATSARSLWYYLFNLRAAKLLGNRVDLYGCGIGPVNGAGNRRMVRRVLDRCVDRVTLRDPDSLGELKAYGVSVPRLELSADPVLALSPALPEAADVFLRRFGLTPDGNYLGLLLRSWYGFVDKAEAIARCADHAYTAYGLRPVFLSLNTVYDLKAANQVIPYLHCPYTVINEPADPGLLIAVLGRMRAAVSLRLHGLILSAMSGVPLIGISYDPKIPAFLRYLDAGSCFALEEVTAQGLIDALEQALSPQVDREALREKALALQAVEHRNLDAVRELLDEEGAAR